MTVNGYFSLTARQRWALAELGIDAWVRREVLDPGAVARDASPADDADPATAPVDELAQPREAAPRTAPTTAPRTAPTAALRAALGESAGAALGAEAAAPAGSLSNADTTPIGEARAAQLPPADAAAPLELLSFAAAGAVILVSAHGLPEGAERLLRDLHGALARLRSADQKAASPARAAPRSLRFSWPNPELPEVPRSGALRGFLERQVALAAPQSEGELPLSQPWLLSAEPAVLAAPLDARTFELPELSVLLRSGEAKRALWQDLCAAAQSGTDAIG
ncbi:MAG: hypothetical protein AAF515_06090 [Pseudomonadota bacterium]